MAKISTIIFSLLTIFYLTACQTDQPIPDLINKEFYRLKGFQNLRPKHRLKTFEGSTSEQQLLICGRLVSAEDKRVVPNQYLRFTHPNGKEDELSTSYVGMFFIETTVPEGGGSQPTKVTVIDDQSLTYEIYLPPYISSMKKRLVEGNEQQFLADVKKRKDGALVAFITVEKK